MSQISGSGKDVMSDFPFYTRYNILKLFTLNVQYFTLAASRLLKKSTAVCVVIVIECRNDE